MTKTNRRRSSRRKTPQEDPDDDDFSQSLSPCDDENLDVPVNDDDYASSYNVASDTATTAVTDPTASVSDSVNFSNGTTANDDDHPRPTSVSSAIANNSQASPYVSIAPLPVFHGDSGEFPATHLSRFAKVCRANNVTSTDAMKRIFPVTLEGEAAFWYDLNVEPFYASLTWEEMKSSFLEAYDTIELADQLRSELMLIDQGDQESVRSYFLRLQWILRRWPEHGLPENLIRGIFVDGLREEFRNWILPQRPSSLNEALRLAFGLEQVRGIRRKAEVKCGFCDGAHEERDCEVRERMRELWLKGKAEEEEKEEKDGDGETGKAELGRSVSMATCRSGVWKSEGEEEDDQLVGFKTKKTKKQSKCQCGKHQCWKKKLEKSNSLKF